MAETTPRAPARASMPSRMVRQLRARQSSFAVGSLITTVLNGTALLAYGVAAVVVARALGPEQWGYLVWFTAGTTLIAMVADALGIYYANAYLLARGDLAFDLGTVRGTVMTYGAVTGVLVGGLFQFVPAVRAAVFPGFREPQWSWLIAANIAGMVLISQARGIFWGQRSFLLMGGLNLGKSAGFALLAVVLVHGLGYRRGVEVAWAQLASSWLCVAGCLVFFVIRGIGRPDGRYLKACAGMGWRAAAINWMSFAHQRADQYLVSAWLGQAAVGLYGVVVSLAELITQVPGILGMVLYPLTAGDPDQAGAARSTLRRTLAVMAVVAVFLLPLGVFAPQVVTFFFGSQFQESAILLRYLLPAIVFLAGLLMLNNHIAGMGYPMFLFWTMLISLVANLALNFALLPRIGLRGAPLAASLSFAVWLLLAGGYVVRAARSGAVRTKGSG